jgi:hypothetical protein
MAFRIGGETGVSRCVSRLIATLDCDSPSVLLASINFEKTPMQKMYHVAGLVRGSAGKSLLTEKPNTPCIPRSNVCQSLNLFFNHPFRATN